MPTIFAEFDILDRMERAVLKVRDRLLRATQALDNAKIDYAVIGGNAVAVWVGRRDESAVRNTQDVDLLIRRQDLEAVKIALAPAGFICRHAARIDTFLDGPGAKARDAVHIIFAGEKVREEYDQLAPTVEEFEIAPPFRVLELEALLRMKLTSFRLKDRVHVQDMIGVGLIDDTWPERLPPVLAQRLREILADPEG